jgi:hypothetical protein
MPQSVLQDWTTGISLRQQGVLVLALRGPDGLTKESGCKNIVRSLRACVMNSGREGKPMADGTMWRNDPFMRMDLVIDDLEWYHATEAFLQDVDTYNLHFFQHLIHAAAVCGLHHPHRTARNNWWRNDPFMRMDLVIDDLEWYHATEAFLQDVDTYNLHFFQHLIHAAAVCGLHHPHRTARNNWWRFYERCCKKLHVHPETPSELQHRLRDGIRTEEEEQA